MNLIEKCEWDRDIDSLTIYIQDLDDTAETVKILDLFKKVDLSIKRINLVKVEMPNKNQVLTIQSIRDFLKYSYKWIFWIYRIFNFSGN